MKRLWLIKVLDMWAGLFCVFRSGSDQGHGVPWLSSMRCMRSSGFRVTDRDVEIVRFIGLQVAVEARQIAAWQQMDKAHVFRRSKRLVGLGLLRHERVVHGRPGLYLATASGR
jgi:hypothetical protein